MIALEAKDLKVGYGKADVLDGVSVHHNTSSVSLNIRGDLSACEF